MDLTVLGSGGCTLTPRPGCQCPICREAREKGIPYTRTGPSLFLKDINALFDTPEEITYQLNRENILRVDHIFYTHWHPDHTMGMRVVEQLNMEYLRFFIDGKLSSQKTRVYAVSKVMEELKAIRSPKGSYFEFYDRHGLTSLVELKEAVPFKIEDIAVTSLIVENPHHLSTLFVIQEKDKKAIYAPCDCKPLPKDEILLGADLLIIGNVLPEGRLKHGYTLPGDNKLRKEAFSMDELKDLIAELGIKRTIVTHIEEEYGKSFDEYKRIEGEYNIQFAYDGMRIEV
ncbi:MAG: MBL fold metallo-hydrolase [Euryarchaeota archaeon]|nr:MBL fold metallo-hydrolase [Euryarchaeota archaeon]